MKKMHSIRAGYTTGKCVRRLLGFSPVMISVQRRQLLEELPWPYHPV